MKRRGKWTGLALFAAWVGLLAACASGGTAVSDETAAPSASAAEPYEVVMGFPVLGDVPKDLQQVEDAISKITTDKIKAKVRLMAIPFGQWFQQSNLMLTGNDQLDVMLVDFSHYSEMVSAKRLTPLDELLALHGQGIKDVLGYKLGVARVNGKIYTVPTNQLPLGGSAIYMRKDLFDQTGLDLNRVKSVDDLDRVFKAVKESNPQIAVLAPNVQGAMPLTTAFAASGEYDSLLDGLGVVKNSDGGRKVVDWYETPEYSFALKKLRSWYVAGYLPKNAATLRTNNTEQVKSGKAFALIDSDKPAAEKQQSAVVGREMVKVSLQPPLVTSAGVLGLTWAIPAHNSRNPAKAMEFLNLIYTDKDIVNLINFGIEGKHYVKKSENVISILPGDGYRMRQSYMFGNAHLTYQTDTEDPKAREKGSAFEAAMAKSNTLGFTPDLDDVKTEVAAVKNVVAQYVPALETGSVNPDKVLPQFIEKLKAAGIDKIIAEKQKQLDAWLAAGRK
ncbi:ABC transporter substrate-binding protein [Cohnella candidum]|uniref:Extracellular solute-binding protein n=1 Tax=Cohnella candidum TaxID=2674991 RepID=A0A3G3JTI6_9BACL|nr:ABC transporter substrate-binding protein [Cohnella candidum]AYQ71550.1 extracellular solute-binding protein [Cohnella candidum]